MASSSAALACVNILSFVQYYSSLPVQAEIIPLLLLIGPIADVYGDGQFNLSYHAWQKEESLDAIQYHKYTPEANRIIEAVHLSLDDISHAFYIAYESPDYVPFVRMIPDTEKVGMATP